MITNVDWNLYSAFNSLEDETINADVNGALNIFYLSIPLRMKRSISNDEILLNGGLSIPLRMKP